MAYIKCVVPSGGGQTEGMTKVLTAQTTGTYSITSYSGYQNLTVDDFVMVLVKWKYSVGNHGGSKGTGGASNIVPYIEYTASTGSIALKNCTGSATSTNWTDSHNVGACNVWLSFDVYV